MVTRCSSPEDHPFAACNCPRPEPEWKPSGMKVRPNPGKIVATYVRIFEAKRYARKFEKEGRSLEIGSVRPHIDDRIREGITEARYDLWEVDHGGVRWSEPPNFHDWPWGGHLEHRGTPWQ